VVETNQSMRASLGLNVKTESMTSKLSSLTNGKLLKNPKRPKLFSVRLPIRKAGKND
jgi:hypothetical protein